jgi:CubicO group peptidase (beta-lactamase class C family)
MVVIFGFFSWYCFAESGPIDPKEFGEFLDLLFKEKMDEYRIPGAVLVCVKNGQVFYKNGYGYANIESKQGVDPEKTIFRVGSISKLFVATAIMQLVEQGKLDLNEDINTYLVTFKIPSPPKNPLTLKHLLTHTAGFDDLILNESTLDVKERMDLGEYLKDRLPELVMESGQVTSYSNYSYDLAGYIVESVSGMPFHAYIKENILSPLEMNHSSFMPLPELMQQKATPYLLRNGQLESIPHDYYHGYPSGELITTGTDIAKFMIMHLQKGKYKNSEILNEQTAAFMQQQQFTNFPGFPGIAIGFWELYYKRIRIINHSGGVAGFKSTLMLIPEQQIGLFVSINIENPTSNNPQSSLVLDVARSIQERYYPEPPQAARTIPSFDSIPESISGSYRHNRIPRNQLVKAGAFLTDIIVKIESNDAILLGNNRYKRVDELLFQSEDQTHQITFRTNNETNEITHLLINMRPAFAWDKISFVESSLFFVILIFCSALFFVLSIVLFPIRFLLSRKKAEPNKDMTKRIWWLTALIGFLNLTTMIVIGWLFMNSVRAFYLWTLPPGLKELLIVPIITAILGVVLAWMTIKLWISKNGSIFERFFFSIIVVCCVMFTYFLYYWKLMGFYTAGL